MAGDYPNVSVKKGPEWHLRRGHPWLFSGGVSQAPKALEPGAIVRLLDYDGKFVASGYYNSDCDIAVRVLSLDPAEALDEQFFSRRIRSAWTLREKYCLSEETNVFRLVNAEGDFLPGFIVDYYAGVLVIQCHTAGADRLLPVFMESLEKEIRPRAIVLRNDSSARIREGLQSEPAKLVHGSLDSELLVKENGISFHIDPLAGQKTGFYTDQRDKRQALQKYVTKLGDGAKVLNCFSYTCSFSLYALAANPALSTVNVDQSQAALDLGQSNYVLNGFLSGASGESSADSHSGASGDRTAGSHSGASGDRTADSHGGATGDRSADSHGGATGDGSAEKPDASQSRHQFICHDAFAFLDREVARSSSYDVVILDPPAFAKSLKDKGKALKGYARMSSLGLRLVREDGIIVLCSCSGALSMDDFLDTVRQTAGMYGRSLQVLEMFQHGADHPFNVMAPESQYLKVIFCRVKF